MYQYNDLPNKSRGRRTVTGETLVHEACPHCGHETAIQDGSTVSCSKCNHSFDPSRSQILIGDGGTLDAQLEERLADLKANEDLWLAVEFDHGTEYIRYDDHAEDWIAHFDRADEPTIRSNITISEAAVGTRLWEHDAERIHEKDVPAEVRDA